jgi:hypothetical protein
MRIMMDQIVIGIVTITTPPCRIAGISTDRIMMHETHMSRDDMSRDPHLIPAGMRSDSDQNANTTNLITGTDIVTGTSERMSGMIAAISYHMMISGIEFIRNIILNMLTRIAIRIAAQRTSHSPHHPLLPLLIR